MARNNVKVVIDADAKGFDRGIKGAVGTAQVAAGAIVAALAVKALGAVKDFVRESIQSFSNLNESLNALEVTYGSHADGIKALGKEAAANLGISNAGFNQFAVSISNFAKEIAGDSGDVVGTVQALTGRITDFASVMNIDVADAQEKFQSGLAGQSRPLREFGIDVSDARVKAFALANGIGEIGREMTEGEKVQARYGLIMEQTAITAGDFARTSDQLANKQRILNAELEDQKAELGEAIVPLYLELLGLLKTLIPVIADVAYQIGRITGAFTPGEAAAKAYNAELGKTPETLEEVIALADEFAGAEFGLIDRRLQGEQFNVMLEDMEGLFSDVASGGLTEFRQALDDGTTGLKLTADQTEVLATAVDRELGRRMAESADQIHRGQIPALEALADATEGVEGATDDVTSALQRYEDEVRSQTDPLYALVRANEALETATAAVTEAGKEHGEDSPEYVDALMDQAQAFENVKAAQLKVAEQSGLTRQGFESHLRAMGIFTKEQIALILADFDRVNAFRFSDKTVRVSYTSPTTGIKYYHSGGVVEGPRGADVPIIAQAGETIIPAGHSVNGSSNGSSSGGISIVVYAGMGTDGNDVGRRIVEEITAYERRNGTAWRS